MKETIEEVLSDIKGIADQMKETGYNDDATIVNAYCDLIKTAKHYSLPEGGRLMEITDFTVPFKNGFSLPEKCITLDYLSNHGGTRFLLCASVSLQDCRGIVNSESVVNAIISSGSESITMVMQFDFYDDDCGINPVTAIIPNNCINDDHLEFIPFTMLRQFAEHLDIKECMKDITEDIFVVYELGLALSCQNVKEVNEQSRKGLVRVVNGENIWYDEIHNLSLVVH